MNIKHFEFPRHFSKIKDGVVGCNFMRYSLTISFYFYHFRCKLDTLHFPRDAFRLKPDSFEHKMYASEVKINTLRMAIILNTICTECRRKMCTLTIWKNWIKFFTPWTERYFKIHSEMLCDNEFSMKRSCAMHSLRALQCLLYSRYKCCSL